MRSFGMVERTGLKVEVRSCRTQRKPADHIGRFCSFALQAYGRSTSPPWTVLHAYLAAPRSWTWSLLMFWRASASVYRWLRRALEFGVRARSCQVADAAVGRQTWRIG